MKSTFQNGLGWVVVLIATAPSTGWHSQSPSKANAALPFGPKCSAPVAECPTPHQSATNPETPATFWEILNSLYIPTRLSNALRTVVLRSDSLESARDCSTPTSDRIYI